MTPGHERALRELRRMRACGAGGFDFGAPTLAKDSMVVPISLRVGPVEKREGGLKLRERESLVLEIPPGFPFDKPWARVEHTRFRGFPHVIWGKWLCLYQSEVEWSPSDGLYGWFTRLSVWLGRASANDMDPVEGPLEPPHHVVDTKQMPFLISANAPAPAGQFWLGLAEVRKHPNRSEVVGWHATGDTVPEGAPTAFVVILPEPLPMEFPSKGSDFFKVLEDRHVSRDLLITLLQLAAGRGDPEEPSYVVLGAPSCRAPDGTPRQHFAVWATDMKRYLRSSTPREDDSADVAKLRQELADAVFKAFDESTLSWCPVYDDRPEIVVRRDRGRPMASFEGKRVLVLGAGALGSWTCEYVARAKPALLHVVDKAKVKPGLLGLPIVSRTPS